MGNFFGDVLHGIEHFVTGNHQTPDPRKFAKPPMPQSPPQTLPMATPPPGMPPGFNEQQFENGLRTDPDLAGVWQTIQGLGGDIWGVLTNLLPKNADGSVDWGKVGGDVVGFIKNNKQTILDGLAAYSNYQRQNKSDQYAKQALDLAKQNFGENQPLRDQGRAGMLDPSTRTPDISAIKALATQNSGNPFSQALPMASIGMQPGQKAPPIPAPHSPIGARPPALPMAAPSAPLTNPAPSGPGTARMALPMAGDPNAPPTVPTSSTLAPRPKPLQLAPRSPALTAPPTGLQPSRAVLPFAYE